MHNFSFNLSTKVEFGMNSVDRVKNFIKKGEKVLIVTDDQLIKLGLIDDLYKILAENSNEYVIFSDVEQNPTTETIDRGMKTLETTNFDKVIAVGGGSPIDTGKALSVLLTNSGNIYDYLDGRGENKKEIINNPVPLIAIPTTFGTGSEVTMYSVITDKDKIKDSLTSPLIYPIAAIVDSSFSLNAPSKVIINTGLDVLGHALESFTSTIDNPLTNLFALEAIKLVMDNLPKAVNNNDTEAKDRMAYASVLAGSAMSHCGATIPHALGCPLSSYAGLPHGLSVGLLQIPMLEFNKKYIQKDIQKVLNYLQIDAVDRNPVDVLIGKIRGLLNELGVCEKIEDVNLNDQLLGDLINDAAIHGCIGINQKSVDRKDISRIYKELFAGATK